MGGLLYTGQSRRTSGSFTVTCSGAKDIVKRLNKLENGGQTAIKKTVNGFMSRAPAWVSKGIRQHYGVDTAAIKRAGPRKKRGATHINVAGVSVDGATLEYKGRTLTLTHFKMSPKKQPKRKDRRRILIPGQALRNPTEVANIRPPYPYQITAQIILGKKSNLPPGSFIGDGKTPAIPFQRTGSGRMPLEAIHTLSVPQMIDGKARQTIETTISENLGKRFNHYIDQVMK